MRRKIIAYNPKMKALARNLRKKGILFEVLLWRQLKNRQLNGYRFLRQRPIDNYIVDFFCPELMLAIEIDGITHEDKAEADKVRQTRLESFGITVLRFLDGDVRRNIEGVVTSILKWVAEHPPAPPSRGE